MCEVSEKQSGRFPSDGTSDRACVRMVAVTLKRGAAADAQPDARFRVMAAEVCSSAPAHAVGQQSPAAGGQQRARATVRFSYEVQS